VGVQKVRWNKWGTIRIPDYNNWEEFFLVQHKIVSAVKRIQFVSDGVSYILVIMRGRWSNIIVLNAHAPSEEKSDDSKDSFMRN
jgi:hypothetical protein